MQVVFTTEVLPVGYVGAVRYEQAIGCLDSPAKNVPCIITESIDGALVMVSVGYTEYVFNTVPSDLTIRK